MIWFDEDSSAALLILGTTYLVVLAVIAGSVIRAVMRQRSLEHLARVRIAHWSRAVAAAEAEPPSA